jgi:hypothetical protein
MSMQHCGEKKVKWKFQKRFKGFELIFLLKIFFKKTVVKNAKNLQTFSLKFFYTFLHTRPHLQPKKYCRKNLFFAHM